MIDCFIVLGLGHRWGKDFRALTAGNPSNAPDLLRDGWTIEHSKMILYSTFQLSWTETYVDILLVARVCACGYHLTQFSITIDVIILGYAGLFHRAEQSEYKYKK